MMEKEDLEFLNSQCEKNEFSEAKINISSKSLEHHEDVIKEIKKFVPYDGWISLQSSPAKRIQDVNFDVNKGHILAGEFYNSKKESLSVRYDGDKWMFITYQESDDGKLVIKRKVRQLSKIGDNIYLNYDVFYKFDSELGYRPYCSAFTGFTEGK